MGPVSAVMITGVGRRFDIVSSFAAHTTVLATERSPLAPAQYAAQLRAIVPSLDDPGYVPALVELCERHDVRAVIPLIDPDIEVLAAARERGELPALVPDAAMARRSFDKHAMHELLERAGLPSPPTVLPPAEPQRYPVIVKPRWGSNSREINLARDEREMRFFVDYLAEPTVVQRWLDGPESRSTASATSTGAASTRSRAR